MQITNLISEKLFYRFVERLCMLCSYSLGHEQYKRIILDIEEAKSDEEVDVKRLANAFLLILNNYSQTLSSYLVKTIHQCVTNKTIDEKTLSKIIETYYLNKDEDCFYQAGFIHKMIINLDLDKKHELAFLLSNYIILRNRRHICLIPKNYKKIYRFKIEVNSLIEYMSMYKELEVCDYPKQDVALSKEEVISLIKKHKEYIQKAFSVSVLCLYGSITKEIRTSRSDVDFLIQFDDSLLDIERIAKKEELIKYLSEILHGSSVDMVDFTKVVNKEYNYEANNLVVIIK